MHSHPSAHPFAQTPSPRTATTRYALAALGIGVMLGAILAANYVTSTYHFIPIGFGLMATAGTIFAGFSLAARDLVQDTVGRRVVVATILVGSLISYLISEPFIATASAVAFLLAELFDFAVYTPLRSRARFGDRRWAVAVVASNVVGAFVDTVVFLGIAFGVSAILPALAGQMVGKTYATVLYLVVGASIAYLVRRHLSARALDVVEHGKVRESATV